MKATTSLVDALNDHHAVINLAGKCVIMNEFVDPQTGLKDINFSTIPDFKNRYSNRTIKVPTKGGGSEQKPLAQYWLEHLQRRQYEGLVFSPEGDIQGYFNLWRGFACQPVQGDWSLMKQHIFDIICQGDNDLFLWLITWFADLIQRPGGKRPGTAVVFRGAQGTGKGIVASNVGRLLGNHFLHLFSPNQLAGRFNSHLKDRLLVFLDEAFWTGNKAAEGSMKGIITEDWLPVELKGKDVITVKNLIRIIIASNSDWVIPAGIEERRFAFFDVAPDRINDRQYFKAIAYQMDNGGREAMMYDLMHWDISQVDLRTIPRTEGLLDQIVHSMNSFGKFWHEILRSGDLLHSDLKAGWPAVGVGVSTEKFFDNYRDFAKRQKDRVILTSSEMGRELNKLCPNIQKRRVKLEEAGYKDRSHRYFFPPLDECRKAFSSKVKIEIRWEQD